MYLRQTLPAIDMLSHGPRFGGDTGSLGLGRLGGSRRKTFNMIQHTFSRLSESPSLLIRIFYSGFALVQKFELDL